MLTFLIDDGNIFSLFVFYHCNSDIFYIYISQQIQLDPDDEITVCKERQKRFSEEKSRAFAHIKLISFLYALYFFTSTNFLFHFFFPFLIVALCDHGHF